MIARGSWATGGMTTVMGGMLTGGRTMARGKKRQQHHLRTWTYLNLSTVFEF